MANTPFANLFKWQITNTKQQTITEMALNADKIDTKLKENSDNIALKANKVQEGWITATLQNGWVSIDPIKYFKDEFNIVHVKGRIQSGTTTGDTTLFNLPLGYRSGETTYINGLTYASTTDAQSCLISIYASGNVTSVFATKTIINLDFSFRAI